MTEETTDVAATKRIIRECCGQLYTKEVDNVEQMDKFLETQSTKIES